MDFNSIEEEFSMYSDIHKYSIIQFALILYENLGIYHSYLLKDNYLQTSDCGLCKAQRVVKELKNADVLDNGNRIDNLYNFCWNKVVDKINDKKVYIKNL